MNFDSFILFYRKKKYIQVHVLNIYKNLIKMNYTHHIISYFIDIKLIALDNRLDISYLSFTFQLGNYLYIETSIKNTLMVFTIIYVLYSAIKRIKNFFFKFQ